MRTLEIGKRALMAQQLALDVVGHNIANVNTPGFSRQEAVFATSPPQYAQGGVGAIGTGVEVTDIRRIRDAFLDMQLRNEYKRLGEHQTLATAFEELEVIINEPSDSGIRSVMTEFWSALEELANNPESDAVRKTVRETAVTLADTIRHTYKQLADMQIDTDESIRSKAAHVNVIAGQIAELNEEIARAKATGNRPNDLMDRRDALLDELAGLADVVATEDASGWVRVTIGGVSLVDPGGVNEISVENGPGGFAKLVWSAGGNDVTLTSGEIAGHIRARDVYIAELKSDLDSLAQSIIDEVNTQHKLGFDLNGAAGGDFFAGSDAMSIRVADPIMGDVALIAAASPSGSGLEGDGANALALAQLKQKFTMASGGSATPNVTWDDFLRGVIAELGVNAEHETRMAENEDYLVTQMENQRQSVIGVSLDEEMTNMIRFQQAYNAAARIITVADEMLEVLISRTGLTGR